MDTRKAGFKYIKSVLPAIATCFFMAGAPALAQEKFPSHPIQIIVPTPPGGGLDSATRKLGELVEPILGQKIVVSNKPGSGGMLGMASVVQAKPDGYTLGAVWNAPLTMTPHAQPAPYAPTDYTAIMLADIQPGVLCVKPDVPANNGKELIEMIRANPDKFTYGTDGIGAIMHLSSERIFNKFGVKARAVPFGGASDTLKNFLGGHVDIYSAPFGTIRAYVASGAAKCLLLTTKDRNDAVPQASSLTELGAPEVATNAWHGLVGPKGIPPDRLAILEKAFIQASQSEGFRTLMVASGGIIPTGQQSAVAFRELIDTEYAEMGVVMRTLGLGKQ